MAQKKKGKQGFASNPQNINKKGRPEGSRNKTTLMKAQLAIDDAAEAAIETLIALMSNDKALLGIDGDVPLTLRMNASKLLFDKSIANEKEKEKDSVSGSQEDFEEDTTPIVQLVPIKKEGG